MWKIITLFTLVVLAQAADIHDIYGEWWQLSLYPGTEYYPLCLRISFTKSTEEVKCTYGDGRNATLVQVTMMTAKGKSMLSTWVPMMMVNSPDEVMPALNISVKCDEQDMRNRFVVRLVNEDYFILYQNFPGYMYRIRSETEPNLAKLFGRKPVSANELITMMMSIEDLMNRQGAPMCGKEDYYIVDSRVLKIK